MGLTENYSESDAETRALLSKFGDDDGMYHIDKKVIQDIMSFMADIINDTEEASKYLRSLTSIGVNLSDAVIYIDASNIYAKESKAKLLQATKNQLPF